MSQIRGGYRLSDNGGGGIALEKIFSLFGPKFGQKVRGDPGPFPGSATANPSGYMSHW